MRMGFVVVLALISGCTAQSSLEHKLLGEWHGGPCMGSITFRPDGTHERFHYSPGNYHLAGQWRIQWPSLPPTLVMTCKSGDEKDEPLYYVGKVQNLKLLQLDDLQLVYQYSGAGSSARYVRDKDKAD